MVALGAAMLMACGDDAVSSAPLAGSLNGTPWMALSASARTSSTAGERSVHMYPNADAGCSLGDDPYVAAVLPWKVGEEDLGLSAEATVFIFMDQTAHLVLDGRVEVLEAPNEVGAVVPFRIRAIFEDGDDDLHVEGEVQVEICD